MISLKLDNTDPMPGHPGTKILAGTHPEFSKPKPTVVAQNAPPSDLNPQGSRTVGSLILKVLPANACTVPGCKRYGQQFASPQALLEHTRAVHHRRTTEHRPGPPAPIIAATSTEPAKKYKCKECAAPFDTTHEMARHIRITHRPRVTKMVAGKRVWPCPHCDKNCSCSTSLKSHIAREHPEHVPAAAHAPPNKMFSCAHCSESFDSKQKLGAHVQWTHKRRDHTPPQTSPLEKRATLDPRNTFFLRFTGTKAECGNAALLLLENGYNHLTTGEI